MSMCSMGGVRCIAFPWAIRDILKLMSKLSPLFAGMLLVIMALMMLATIGQDSITTDEAPHITAGYSYLAFQDYRINPEHPPLVKDLAALPIYIQERLGLWQVNFPLQHSSWTTNVNDQWTLGPQFLSFSGNDSERIIWWGRLAPVIITLILGVFVYVWTQKLFGPTAALFALTLYAFSPEFLAHGRLVTTDVPAAAMFFIATFFYIRFLRAQTKKNFLIAGVVLGVAQLTKFSLFIIWPYLGILAVMWMIAKDPPLNLFSFQFIKKLARYTLQLCGIAAVAYIVLLPVYQFHVVNYPAELQIRDIDYILTGPGLAPVHDALVWMADKPVLRAWGQYLFGLTMVFLRVGGGNTTYFFGEISNIAWREYFPLVFAIKVPLALLVFLALSLMLAIKAWWRQLCIVYRAFPTLGGKLHGWWQTKRDLVTEHFDEVAMLTFIFIYWAASMTGNLNIGVRHVLPTVPFLYILIAGQVHRWIHANGVVLPENPLRAFLHLTASLFKKSLKAVVVILLIVWYMSAAILVYPHYIAYFNELVGGPEHGYKYVVDSNLDWGQDARRLARFVDERGIDKIKVAYFGGSQIQKYLGSAYEELAWNGGRQEGWIAISATLLQGGRGIPAKGFDQNTTNYMWLNEYEPVAKIGYSIFVYYIPPLQ